MPNSCASGPHPVALQKLTAETNSGTFARPKFTFPCVVLRKCMGKEVQETSFNTIRAAALLDLELVFSPLLLPCLS